MTRGRDLDVGAPPRGIVLRPRRSLFHAEGGWFSANWHFSFDRYWDEANMGIGHLRVFNDDRLVPGAAWPMHPHRDIEGITYVAEGTFEHADSMGNGGILPPGSVQRATLGSGMEHSERNGSQTEPMRFIQMWIIPSRRGLPPSIEQRSYGEDSRRDRLLPVLVPAQGYGAPDAPASADAVTVHQDAAVYAGLLSPRASVSHRFRTGFGGYLFIVHGDAEIAGAGPLDEGGAAKIALVEELEVAAGDGGAEILLVVTKLA
ncbi:MAG: pirin family protein [Candidatus Limnocylindria bacterium]